MINPNSSLAIMVLDKGENMYPYLFALFLSDLENFMENQNSTGLNTITEDIDTALLNADDTVLMSESLEELQEN